ncbi:MAG: GGDEF domain-containing phosphodiesterase [Burkholderiales bacterium]
MLKSDALDITLSGQILDAAVLRALADLSEGVLEHGALVGADDVQASVCRDALQALAEGGGDVTDRLRVWLGEPGAAAVWRVRALQDVLQAHAAATLRGDPGQASATVLSLQRLGLLLGRMTGAGRDAGVANEDAALMVRLRLPIEAARAAGVGAALLLVRCDSVARMDVGQGVDVGNRLRDAIRDALRAGVLRDTDELEPASRSEFACLLQPIASEGVAVLAAQKILRVLDKPLRVGGEEVVPGAAVGIALLPEHGERAELLVPRARAALEEARVQPDHCGVFHAALPDADIDHARYESRLRTAIRHNTLDLAFQPQADVRSGRMVGAEALLRWSDKELGTVPPNIAVAVAEGCGLIHELTLWVITAAIQRCAQFRRIDPAFAMSINVSPSDLTDPELADFVDRALRTWNVPAQNVVLEVTETAIVRDQKAAVDALQILKRLGLRISIDDFGTGYSSMYYLAHMPLDELKIDLMFVRAMLEQPQYAKIVRSLIELAHNLELEVVAEGVENEEVQAALAHLRCDRVQGYYIGKPMPAEALEKLLRATG